MSARLACPLVLATLLLAGCGGGGGEEPPVASTPTGTTDTTDTTAAPGPVELVRWPRFWATRDTAETGTDDNLSTQYYVGFDDAAVVYNGQDVVRALKPATGKVIGRVVLPTGRLICAVSPRREIDAGVAVFGVGALRRDVTCDQVMAVSTRTGKVAWRYDEPGRAGREAVIDQRDGKVLWSDRTSITVLDAASGRVVWTRSARRLVRKPDCEIAPSLAADAPVVIVYPNSCNYDGEKILGLSLDDGQQLWSTRDPRDPRHYSSYQVHPHALDGRYIGPVTDPEKRKQPGLVAFVDSTTGEATAYAAPRMPSTDGEQPAPDTCSDSTSSEGLQWADECVFIAGDRVLYVDAFVPNGKEGVAIIAADLATGEVAWRALLDEGADGQYPFFTVLGFNADRTEFWVSQGRDRVVRLRIDDGAVVGRGKLGPPLDIPRFTVAAPNALYIRGSSGIGEVKSGLDYYKTDAP
jgi:hypothetical protein